ncbi:MAG: hypothetical protein LBI05_01830 [Planctomycetaceae bacterium]|jgi:hypothetical protein|nr:hypothetical protein [Planctomycetaceae bacterium]
MKNTIAGASLILASMVSLIMFASVVKVSMVPGMDPNGGIAGCLVLLFAGFVYLRFGLYYFNTDDKTDSR